jgi:putative hydrolase of the HAD superfamily
MRNSEIQMVFFDAAGTLFHVRGSVGEIYARYAWQFNKQVEAGAIQNKFAHKFRQQPPLAFARNLTPAERLQQERQWWRRLVQEVFVDFGEFPQFEDYFETLFAFFSTAAAWELSPDTKSTLAALKQRNLRLGVISNFDARLYDVLWSLELREYFASIHISSEVGAAKPEGEIFSAALQENQLSPQQAMHVGDSWHEDVQGAQRAGLRAIWLNSQSDAAATGITRVNCLGEILALL